MGPRALVKRLTSPSAQSQASDQGWPPPSPKEKHEATLRQHQADRLPVETLIKLLDAGGNRFAIGELRWSYKDDPDGRRRPNIRIELLKSFAAKAASN